MGRKGGWGGVCMGEGGQVLLKKVIEEGALEHAASGNESFYVSLIQTCLN